MEKPYRDYADFLHSRFDGKIQKVSVDAGFTCPNRDGSIGTGGCTYCSVDTFTPGYCRPTLSVEEQIERGKQFFARKYPSMRYLVYFQAYTSSRGAEPQLLDLYNRALRSDDVVGLVIGTRPDCMSQSLLDELAVMNRHKYVMIEYGAESSHDSTLAMINRCHTWAATVDAVERTANTGIDCGVHLIMGLPGESIDMMTTTIDRVARMPINTVKLHQLQLIEGTRMTRDVEEGRYDIMRFSVEQYMDLCINAVRRLPRSMAIDRFVSQSPADKLVYPCWGLKNYEFTHRLVAKMSNHGYCQGDLIGETVKA